MSEDRGIYMDGHAERLKEHAGEKYRPSNGEEGELFMSRHCLTCLKDKDYREHDGDSCPIVAATFCHDVDDPLYPAEWIYGNDGQPTCTAYEEDL